MKCIVDSKCKNSFLSRDIFNFQCPSCPCINRSGRPTPSHWCGSLWPGDSSWLGPAHLQPHPPTPALLNDLIGQTIRPSPASPCSSLRFEAWNRERERTSEEGSASSASSSSSLHHSPPLTRWRCRRWRCPPRWLWGPCRFCPWRCNRPHASRRDTPACGDGEEEQEADGRCASAAPWKHLVSHQMHVI